MSFLRWSFFIPFKSLIPRVSLWLSMIVVIVIMMVSGIVAKGQPKVLSSSSSEFVCQVQLNKDLSDLDIVYDSDSTLYIFKTFAVAIPPGAVVEVEAVSLKSQTLADDILSMYGNPALQPLAVLSHPVSVRGRRIVSVHVFPIQGTTIHTQIEVTVRFIGGSVSLGGSVLDPLFDRVIDRAVLNADLARQWNLPGRLVAKAAFGSVFEDQSTWYRIGVRYPGLVKVTGAQLRSAGVSLASLSSNDISLWAGEGCQLSSLCDSTSPEFSPVAILVEDGGDGQFDNEDWILFYGESVDRWIYDGPGEPTRHFHHYTDENSYWLSVDPALSSPDGRMANFDGTPTGVADTVVTHFQRWVHAERDAMLSHEADGRIYDYYEWYWTDDATPDIHVSTPGYESGSQTQISVGADMPSLSSTASLIVNGALASVNGCDRKGCTFESDNLINGLNQLNLTFIPNSSADVYLDWVDIGYTSDLTPDAEKLEFAFPGLGGRALVEIGNDFSSESILLNITEPRQPVRISGQEDSGLLKFEVDMDLTASNHFYVSGIDRATAPSVVEAVTMTGLTLADEQVDYLIVGPRQFQDQLSPLAAFRQSQGYTTKLVATEDIYINFSHGLFDPAAIREFLRFTYENYPNPKPSAVLLVGDGNYDFRNNQGHDAPNYVPPFIHPFDTSFSYSDDNYVYFGDYGQLDSDSSYYLVPDRGLDMISARWSARTQGDVTRLVEKTIAYENNSEMGVWHRQVMLVADDEFSSERNNEIVHTQQTEDLQAGFIPRLFTRDKIYLIEHEFVNNRKPTANDAIVDGLNEGRLLVNYVGHGNPGVWAHERVFTSSGDLPRLQNGDKLPLIFAASCAIGFFDSPEATAMAEEFLTHPDGGAIAVVSATRLVWSSLNRSFNQSVFDILFDDPDISMCEAVYAGKLVHIYGTNYPPLIRNDRSYTFFGEPLTTLARPELQIEFSSQIDTLVSLRPETVSGRIVNSLGNTVSVVGTIQVEVFDSDRMRTYVPSEHGGGGSSVTYAVDGATLYRGDVTVDRGQFEFTFVPGLDISYGGANARIDLYGSFGRVDAAGLMDSIFISPEVSPVTDNEGPQIRVTTVDDAELVDGAMITPGDTLIVSIFDPSGVNTTGWLGHGITLTLDGEGQSMINLTPMFEYSQDSYTMGMVLLSTDSLSAGQHVFLFKAWDNANNSTSLDLNLELGATFDMVVRDLLNYPNPMRDETQFSFYTTQGLEKFSLEIFTLAGRKIKSFRLFSIEPGYCDDIIWNGTDETGDRVAAGVYMIKAQAQPENGHETAVIFGKIVVLN